MTILFSKNGVETGKKYLETDIFSQKSGENICFFVVRIFADTWSKILSGYKDRYFYGQICGHIRLNPFIYQYFRHFRRIGISAKFYSQISQSYLCINIKQVE